MIGKYAIVTWIPYGFISCTSPLHAVGKTCGATQVTSQVRDLKPATIFQPRDGGDPSQYGNIWDTPWKIDMEPQNYPFRKENDLNQTSMIMFHVNLQGCRWVFPQIWEFISNGGDDIFLRMILWNLIRNYLQFWRHRLSTEAAPNPSVSWNCNLGEGSQFQPVSASIHLGKHRLIPCMGFAARLVKSTVWNIFKDLSIQQPSDRMWRKKHEEKETETRNWNCTRSMSTPWMFILFIRSYTYLILLLRVRGVYLHIALQFVSLYWQSRLVIRMLSDLTLADLGVFIRSNSHRHVPQVLWPNRFR